MKRLLLCIITAFMTLMPCAYADGTETPHCIYTSISPTFALSEGLLRGADDFSVHQLVQPQEDCIRLYELSDWDIVQLSVAEVCIIWGNGLESFADTLIQAEDGPTVVAVSDIFTNYILPDELKDYDYFEHFSGENPHSYISLSGMAAALDSLYSSLCELYPDYSDTISANYERMTSLINAASDELNELKSLQIAEPVAALFEGAPYMLDELDISWQYVYPREPASSVTGEDLSELLDRLKQSGLHTVAVERQAPADFKRLLSDAGFQVRQVSTLMTINEPTLEEYIASIIDNAHSLIGK